MSLERFKNETVMVVVAHPDDEVLGAGGIMAALKSVAKEVHVLIMGKGLAARTENGDMDQHMQSVDNARNILGYKETHLEDFPDNRFDSVPLLDVVKVFETYKNKIKPKYIFTHWSEDLNVDHQTVFKAVVTGSRPMVGETVKGIFSFENPSATEWNFTRGFRPSFYVELTEKDVNAKCEAMAAYASEIRDFPHPRSVEYLKSLATVRGGESGLGFAEAFEVVRLID